MAVDWDKTVLQPLMSQGMFGETVRPIYMPMSGSPFEIDGVFDRAYKGLTLEADGEPVIATRDPVLGVRLAQFTAEPLKGDRVKIPSDGRIFMVADVQPDGHGWAKLQLMISKSQVAP